MKCLTKSSSWFILLVNSLIAFAACLFVHFIWYGIKDFSAYSRSGFEIGMTAIFAIAYAYLFNKVTHHWRLDYGYGIIPKQSGGSKLCGNSMTNFLNSILFAIIIMAIVFAVMTFAGVFVSTFYVFILDGIRGAVPPPDETTVDAAAAAAQIGGATIALEFFGKTEGTPRKPL